MKKKIAIPNESLYGKLTANAEEVCKENDFLLIADTEERIGDLFRRNSADLALLPAVDLIRYHHKGDFRIVPGPALSLEGRTGHFFIRYQTKIKNPETCLITAKSPNLKAMAAILFTERYGLSPEITLGKPKGKTPDDFDIIIDDTPGEEKIDFSEDWFDSFGVPMPMAVWAGRNEEFPEETLEIVNKIADSSLKESEKIEGNPDLTLHPGYIAGRWSENFEKALVKFGEMLFYKGKTIELADIKTMEM